MKRFEVSPVTVQQALRSLSGIGLIETRPGIGTFTRAKQVSVGSDFSWQTAALGAAHQRLEPATSLKTVPDDFITLHSGYPSTDLLPVRQVRAALGRAARSGEAVARASTAGLPELQSWFAQELSASMEPAIAAPSARDVVIFPGSQAGLSALFRSLIGAGEPLIVESPTYWGAMLAARNMGARLIPIPSGADGPDPAELERAFVQTGARAFYAQPNFANPTGAQWSAALGQRILEVVRSHGAFLIEDDWAHDFGISSDAKPLASHDADGHVVHVRSLTKSVSPAVRVAGITARGPAKDRLLAESQAQNMYVSPVLQVAALDVVTQPGWRAHLRALRTQLQHRRDQLASSVAARIPQASLEHLPRGGLNLWLRLPDDTDLVGLQDRCAGRGVMIAAGDEWFPTEPTGRYVRLNYAAADSTSFDEAATVLGEELGNVKL